MKRHRLVLFMLGTIGVVTPPLAYGQGAIFLLRHAERMEYESRDGLLSEAGLARAERLVRALKDAGVTTILTSEWQRTIQTARPLAAALNIPITTVGGRGAEQVQATIAHVGKLDPSEVVVIVGHGNTVLMMLRAFGDEQDLTIGDRDSLLVVTKLREWEQDLWVRFDRDSVLVLRKPARMLGNTQEVTLGNHEHDDLFVIVRNPDRLPTILRLNY